MKTPELVTLDLNLLAALYVSAGKRVLWNHNVENVWHFMYCLIASISIGVDSYF